MNVAFDVDDTLIVPSVATGLPTDTPNYETISVFRWFAEQGHHMIIWSGSGVDYARRWSEKLGLAAEIREKKLYRDVDLAFDDMAACALGRVNVQVRRIKNSVSRKEWNATKEAKS